MSVPRRPTPDSAPQTIADLSPEEQAYVAALRRLSPQQRKAHLMQAMMCRNGVPWDRARAIVLKRTGICLPLSEREPA